MPTTSGVTAARASFMLSSSRTSSLSAACTQRSPLRSVNTRQLPWLLKPAASGANARSGAEAERIKSRPCASSTWKAILVS